MKRRRFRSQPHLDHGERRGIVAPVAVIALSAAVFGGSLWLWLETPPETSQTSHVVETTAIAPPITRVAAVTPPPLIITPPAEAAPVPAPTRTAAAPMVEEAPAKAPVRRVAQADPAASYREALREYEAQEREEGFRWAKRFNVTTERYCRQMRQRNEAFMEGCLDYQSQAANEANETFGAT